MAASTSPGSGAPSEPAANRLIGKIWEADQIPPVLSNWPGCVGSLTDLAAAARDAELEYTATVAGVNPAMGVAALRVWRDGTEAGASRVWRDLGALASAGFLTP
jgi:hypothetical protein